MPDLGLNARSSNASRRFSAHRCLLHRCCRGQCNWRCYAGPEAQHHRLISSRRCFFSSYQATARPRVSGSDAPAGGLVWSERPVQLALLRRSLRLRLRPAPSTSSGSRRYFIRSWQATTVRPLVGGSAAGSSATLIASNVIVFSADPFGSQSPPLGSLGRVLFSPRAQARLGGDFGPLPLPGSSPAVIIARPTPRAGKGRFSLLRS
jgi:hypothetical protein